MATGPLLLPSEAERLVETIRLIIFEEIGGKEWMKQHQSLEKLNMQVMQGFRHNFLKFNS